MALSLFKNNEWNQIPGTNNNLLYPFIRPVDIFCSNSYIIQTQSQIIIIDPGTDRQQITKIISLVDEILKVKPLKVFIYLTHCHGDHCCGISQIIDCPDFEKYVIIHNEGARAFLNKNTTLIQTELIGFDLPEIKSFSNFLLQKTDDTSFENFLCLADYSLLKIKKDTISISAEDNLMLYEISYDEDKIIMYHTPGHSPDSCCIKIGDILFMGDLPFSSNLLIAGIYGWSQKDLLSSLKNIINIIDKENVKYFCSGHGDVLDYSIMKKLLEKNLKDSVSINNIYTIDSSRAKKLTEYSRLLLKEAQSIFVVIAGRIFRASHYLSDLGEEDASQKLDSLIDYKAIDDFISDFSKFTNEYEQNKAADISLALKGVAFVKRIEKIFNPAILQNLIDDTLLKRASRLLTDFINAARGIKVYTDFSPCDLNLVINKIILSAKKSVNESLRLFDTTDDEALFVQELAKRFAHVPVLEKIDFEFIPQTNLSQIQISEERLFNIINTIFEHLSICGAKKIKIKTYQKSGKNYLEIITEISENKSFSADKQNYISMYLSEFNIDFYITRLTSNIECKIEFPIFSE